MPGSLTRGNPVLRSTTPAVPKPLIDRMNKAKAAAGEDKKAMRELQEQEGIKITVELIQQALEIPGVKGVHIQAIEWETAMEPIVKAAGLYPRPTIPAE